MPMKNLNYILILLLVLHVSTIGGVIYLLKEMKSLKGSISEVKEERVSPQVPLPPTISEEEEITGPPKITSIFLIKLEAGKFVVADEFKKGENIGVKGKVENLSYTQEKKAIIDYQIFNKKGEKISEVLNWLTIGGPTEIESCCLVLPEDVSPGEYIVRIILDSEKVTDLPFKLID
ncbi:MAG: hypothetical protein Q8M00_00585 [bacterium]|nr:hypothetical protein [bacterium]